MIRLIILLGPKAGISERLFFEHWQKVHKPLVEQLPGLRRYRQSRAHEAGMPFAASSSTAVAELWFDSIEDLQAAWRSPQEQVAKADAETFIDVNSLSMIVVSEVV
jgi:uncharacterized protein (TIGR02118 family)